MQWVSDGFGFMCTDSTFRRILPQVNWTHFGQHVQSRKAPLCFKGSFQYTGSKMSLFQRGWGCARALHWLLTPVLADLRATVYMREQPKRPIMSAFLWQFEEAAF